MAHCYVKDEEFSESQADREFNCPLYKCHQETTRLASGTKWERDPSKLTSTFTHNDLSKIEATMTYVKGRTKKCRSRKYVDEELVMACNRRELPQAKLVQISTVGDHPDYNEAFIVQGKRKLGKRNKIALYVRTFE